MTYENNNHNAVIPIWQPNLKRLEQFVADRIRDDVAEPTGDDIFDAAIEGHYELSRFKSKSGNPEVWSGENIIGATNFTMWNSLASDAIRVQIDLIS
jgi:hypothetical protein